MLAWCSALALAFCVAATAAQNGAEADLVTSLPGLSETPTFQHYSGYLQAGSGKYFHYWFVESQNNPSTDPFILWLNGGPGCSSLEGMLSENGPFHLHDDATVYLNPYSWNLVANVLYLESPAGVGFSYSTTGNYSTSDPQVAEDNYNALLDFFNKFPSFASNNFYIFAESYGGVYGPSLAQYIISNSANINLKGVGVGNGMTNYALNDQSLIYFGYYHGLFSESLWNQMNQACCSGGSCNFYSNSDSNCMNAVYQALYVIQDIGLNIYNLYGQCYGGAPMNGRYAADVANLFRDSGFTFQPQIEAAIPGVPMCINGTAMYEWLNNPEVRSALHIPTSVQSWELCSHTVGTLYQRTYTDMTSFYQSLLQKNLQLLVYNGDVDMACNFLGAKWFVDSLNLQALTQYGPWYFEDQIAGYVQQYKNLTLLTVKGAGHMVPEYKPGPALQLLKNYLANSY
ncbi:lysosomal protective protein-like [Denticeps clupeoides]|uniref:Carboxypeptidase n=1 Tax=Denticeps clupeoides TaxID=299321 RepID=A0AAY4CBY8_9TELE|nr:lysosomal protective protein-like [Denticeps clupeoides]XP_028842959.1 lysosomal protective protein-like [Denticeps clupeoides]XP_028842960.1 lysosomal protective protein-like [Denticeps clupeoides]